MNDSTERTEQHPPQDNFEAPDFQLIEITVRNRSNKYRIYDISANAFAEFSSSLNVQDKAKLALAKRNAQCKPISMAVRREDDTPISFDDAKAMRVAVTQALEKAILKFNGLSEESEVEVKNA